MFSARTLYAKMLGLGAALLSVAVLSVGLTMWISWQLEGGAAAVNEAGRLRMQVWRLVAEIPFRGPAVAQTRVHSLDASLALLRDGDSSRPLALPWDQPTRHQFDRVNAQWSTLRAQWLALPPPPTQTLGLQAEAFVGALDGLVGAIEHSLAAWTAILSLVQMAMMALAIGAALVLLYAGYAFVLTPLAALDAGLTRIEEGDLGARVQVHNDDEFGQLARGFNRMAQTLQELYRTLEHKVREKTAGLELQRQRLARLYTISDFLARTGTLEEMAQGFARQIRVIAGADAAAVRWSDEANQRHVLIAGDCLPQALAAQEHCVRTGECMCGQPQESAGTRVIPIHAQPQRRLACAEAGFQALISVPVMAQQHMLGEIDLFYRHPVELGGEERQHLEALASHLASAMEGLRAQALERESAVAQERALLARELHDSIAQSLAFLKIQVGLLRGAIRRADDGASARALDELDAGVQESTADVRELLLHFRTRTNAEDIVPALRTTLRKFEHQSGLSAQLRLRGDGLPLAPDVQIQVLHVVQEALSNVRKHARAQAVRVDVRQGPAWQVEVRDDGVGFDPDASAAGELQVGLRIMRERAERIGATVAVESRPGAGTLVRLTLPAREQVLAA